MCGDPTGTRTLFVRVRGGTLTHRGWGHVKLLALPAGFPPASPSFIEPRSPIGDQRLISGLYIRTVVPFELQQHMVRLLPDAGLARMTGLEPATFRSTGGCSDHLSYIPMKIDGAGDRARTDDPLGGNQMLFQLSYACINNLHSFKLGAERWDRTTLGQ